MPNLDIIDAGTSVSVDPESTSILTLKRVFGPDSQTRRRGWTVWPAPPDDSKGVY
jgi:hypothetical protein